MSDVTRILSAIDQGDPHAASQLLPLVYEELRKLAAQKLANETPGQTLQPTALVHEAYLRLVASPQGERQEEPPWDSRGHFFAAAAEANRDLLTTGARAVRETMLSVAGSIETYGRRGETVAAAPRTRLIDEAM